MQPSDIQGMLGVIGYLFPIGRDSGRMDEWRPRRIVMQDLLNLAIEVGALGLVRDLLGLDEELVSRFVLVVGAV